MKYSEAFWISKIVTLIKGKVEVELQAIRLNLFTSKALINICNHKFLYSGDRDTICIWNVVVVTRLKLWGRAAGKQQFLVFSINLY